MEDDTTDKPHVEEAHMAVALNNLDKIVTSDTTNLAQLTMKMAKLAEQLQVALAQNNMLTDLLSKNIWDVTATQSENHNINKRQCTENTSRRETRTIKEEKQYALLGYFWTHGYKVDVGHNIWICRTGRYNKNHNKKVTRVNTMVGRKRNIYGMPDKWWCEVLKKYIALP